MKKYIFLLFTILTVSFFPIIAMDEREEQIETFLLEEKEYSPIEQSPAESIEELDPEIHMMILTKRIEAVFNGDLSNPEIVKQNIQNLSETLKIKLPSQFQKAFGKMRLYAHNLFGTEAEQDTFYQKIIGQKQYFATLFLHRFVNLLARHKKQYGAFTEQAMSILLNKCIKLLYLYFGPENSKFYRFRTTTINGHRVLYAASPDAFLQRISRGKLSSLLEKIFTQEQYGKSILNYSFSIKELTANNRLLQADSNSTLDLGNMRISSLEGLEMIPNIGKIIKLNLGNNLLTTLKKYAFGAAYSLTHLWVNNNLIKTIEPLSFAGLSDLEYLELEHNELAILKNKIFFGLNKLKKLFLRNNKITHIQDNVFDNLRRLQELHINKNRLSPTQQRSLKQMLHSKVLIVER